MFKEIKVSVGGKVHNNDNDDGHIYHEVKIGDRIFENVPTLQKFEETCCRDNCKYYRECSWSDGPVRTFDCVKNRKKVTSIYLFVTCVIIATIAAMIFRSELSIFRKIAAIIFELVAMDVLCSVVEYVVPQIRNFFFLKKLLKRDKEKIRAEEKEKEAEEQAAAVEAMQKMASSEYYGSVLEAESFVKKLRAISDKYDYGINDQKIDMCINKLEDIVEILKENNSNYDRVAFLFEVYLPEFYNILKQYGNFIDAGFDDEEDIKETLTKFSDKFLNFLNSQKIESRLGQGKSQAKAGFTADVDALMGMLDKGED